MIKGSGGRGAGGCTPGAGLVGLQRGPGCPATPLASWAPDTRPDVQVGSSKSSPISGPLPLPPPSTLPPVLAAWGVGARLRRGRGLLERSPVPAERAQKHPSSSQSLISKPILRSKEPALPGEMAASRAGAGSTQGEPAASCSARKVGKPPKHPHWWEYVRGTRTQLKRFPSGRDWNSLGSNNNKNLLTDLWSPKGKVGEGKLGVWD